MDVTLGDRSVMTVDTGAMAMQITRGPADRIVMDGKAYGVQGARLEQRMIV
jgi:hypothetical protein